MALFRLTYRRVPSDDEYPLTAEEKCERERIPESLHISTILLTVATLLLSFHSLYVIFWRSNTCQNVIFRNGYATEWNPAKESIYMEKVTYTSAIRYNATEKSYYREFDPSLPQYVGKPGPHIDKAWEDLLEGQYLALSKAEALQLDDPVPINGYYLAEVEVMHSLHCLNAVRKAMSPEYYQNDHHHDLLQSVKDIHIDHCIEQLRQNIQCAGDLTPLMLRPWGEGDNALLIGTPQVHTCRNWEKFRAWYTDRGTRLGKVTTTSL